MDLQRLQNHFHNNGMAWRGDVHSVKGTTVVLAFIGKWASFWADSGVQQVSKKVLHLDEEEAQRRQGAIIGCF